MAAKPESPSVGEDGEAGVHRHSEHDETDGGDSFSDGEAQSWHSAYHSRRLSNASSLSDNEASGGDEPWRGSDGSPEIDLERGGIGDFEAKIAKSDKDCRICHLSLVGGVQECGIAIELGCSCKDDLAAAHRQCAETWFKIKGNRICEVCGAVAKNVVGGGDSETAEQWQEGGGAATPPPGPPAEPAQSFWQSHRLLNLLLACLVLALFVSWLFHFNVPG
ncbi:uncharacterized protein LOC144700298 [Wolffia australiana]